MEFNFWTDALIIAGFLAVFSIPVMIEAHKKANAPKPRGATRV